MQDDNNDQIDEASQESFPASDAPANTPETGIRIGELNEPPAETDDAPAPSAPR
jgi:hypothetical protein